MKKNKATNWLGWAIIMVGIYLMQVGAAIVDDELNDKIGKLMAKAVNE